MGCGTAGPVFEGRAVRVPGDFSSAAFWLVAAAAREGAVIEMDNVGLNPRRTALLDVLKRMGADVNVMPDVTTGDSVGRLRVQGRRCGVP